jgi:hypothetical protein
MLNLSHNQRDYNERQFADRGLATATYHNANQLTLDDDKKVVDSRRRPLPAVDYVILDELPQLACPLIARTMALVECGKDTTVFYANGDANQTCVEHCNNIGERKAYLDRVLPKYFPQRVRLVDNRRLESLEDRLKLAAIQVELLAGTSIQDIIDKFTLQRLSTIGEVADKGIDRVITATNLALFDVVQQLTQLKRGSSDDYKGMRVKLRVNTRGLFVGREYTVAGIRGSSFELEGQGTASAGSSTAGGKRKRAPERRTFPRANFVSAIGVTAHSAQGATFDSPHLVMEWDKMDASQLLVALSRCKRFSDLYFYTGPQPGTDDHKADKVASLNAQDRAAGRPAGLTVSMVDGLLRTFNGRCAMCYEPVAMQYESDDPDQWSVQRANNDLGHAELGQRLTIIHFNCNRADGTAAKAHHDGRANGKVGRGPHEIWTSSHATDATEPDHS